MVEFYPDSEERNLYSKRTPNIARIFLKAISTVYGKLAAPERIFHYVYAVLYSNIYRTKYATFLKTDFPRISFTKNPAHFKALGEMGKALVDLHLLKSAELDAPVARFQGAGESRMVKQRYDEAECRVYINSNQYFEGIEKTVWDYRIGGYQVLDKWLKDRKKRILSLEEIRHYCRVVTALQKTIEIQKQIDERYDEIEEAFLQIDLN